MLILDQLKRSDRHLQVIALVVLLGIGVLFARLWQMQVLRAATYRAQFQEHALRTVPIQPIRGKILDRNRVPLVENRPSFNVNLYLEDFSPKFREAFRASILQYKADHNTDKVPGAVRDYLQPQVRFNVVSELSSRLSGLISHETSLTSKEFEAHFNNSRTLPYTIFDDLPIDKLALFSEKTSFDPAVQLDVEPRRIYRFGSLAAHFVGHLKKSVYARGESGLEDLGFDFPMVSYKGALGVEAALDDALRGRPGVKSILVNSLAYRQSESIEVTPQPGSNVVLTIDQSIQAAAEKAMRRHQGTNTRGAVVVMGVKTGDIFAIASSPSFDPAVYLDRISSEQWASMSDPELRPQFNRATRGAYPPGSVFKIIVGLAALEAGALDPDEIFHSLGYWRRTPRSRPIDCTALGGPYDFKRAFYKSCNCYFIHYGSAAGVHRIVEMARRFGLGEKTGIYAAPELGGYLPDAQSNRKANGDQWRAGDTDNLCIGQGEITVTPLQVAVMTAAVANGGIILEPRLIAEIEPQDPNLGSPHIFPNGVERGRVRVSPAHLKILQDAMLADVEERDSRGVLVGTGKAALIPGFRVCGKTGTAQTSTRGGEKVTWFASYGPYEDPRYAVVALVEQGSSGGEECAPIVRDIYEAILRREKQNAVRVSTLAQHP